MTAYTDHSLVVEVDTADLDQAAMADSLASPYLKQDDRVANLPQSVLTVITIQFIIRSHGQ